MTPQELENAITQVVGEQDSEERGGWYEYYERYTGLNGFYHLLAGTGQDVTNVVRENEKVTGDYKSGLDVEGLGHFTLVETIEDNFDTYEKSWDNFMVFGFDGRTYRKQGYLDSWDGGVWDGPIEEVKPVEVVVTKWERV